MERCPKACQGNVSLTIRTALEKAGAEAALIRQMTLGVCAADRAWQVHTLKDASSSKFAVWAGGSPDFLMPG